MSSLCAGQARDRECDAHPNAKIKQLIGGGGGAPPLLLMILFTPMQKSLQKSPIARSICQ